MDAGVASEVNRVTRFAVNISMVGYPDPLADRLAAVAEAGFTAVEFWFPHQFDMAEMADRTRALDLTVALFDLEPSESHPYGHIADPAAAAGDEYFRRLDDALALAPRLGCRTINVLQGMAIPGVDESRQIGVAVERLSRSIPRAAEAGVKLCIEAINTVDRPGSFCDCTRIGAEIVDAVDSPWVKFQYDVYHMQIMEGNVIRTLEANIGRIGHVQFADPPGRYEPGTGEINFANVLSTLDRLGYAGWVSLEYWPSRPGQEHFDWLPRNRRGRA
jgi:hydroxypyruvate isomerase